MIQLEQKGDLTIVRLEHGKVNALDVELLQAVRDQLQALKGSEARAVVLTGTGSSFSAGVDLFRVLDGGPAYIETFLPLMNETLRELFDFPKPVIAAINGHAIAGGCIFACACDWRVMADGSGKIGVPELLVGVPFPPLALEILRAALPKRALRELIFTGKLLSPQEAYQMGLIDEVAPPEQLLDRACEVAQHLAKAPARTFALTKRQLRQPVLERAERYAVFEFEIREFWASPEAHETIRSYLEETLGKRG